MKQYNKRFIVLSILFCVLVLSGCKNIRFDIIGKDKAPVDQTEKDNKTHEKGENDKKEKKDEILVKKDEIGGVVTHTAIPTLEEMAPVIVQPGENELLMIYTVNSNADIEAVAAAIPKGEKITPTLIVDTVVDSMADNSLMIGVESVLTEDDIVIVNFYKDQPPVTNVGAGFESNILDAIAQSITDNSEDYSKVIYRIEGEAYASGHIELDLDEVYFTK